MSREQTIHAAEMSSTFCGHWLDTIGLSQSAHLFAWAVISAVLSAGIICIIRAEGHGRAVGSSIALQQLNCWFVLDEALC